MDKKNNNDWVNKCGNLEIENWELNLEIENLKNYVNECRNLEIGNWM